MVREKSFDQIVKEFAKKDLPNHVSSQLLEVLTQGKRDAKELSSVKEQCNNQLNTIKYLKSENEKLTNSLNSIERRELDVKSLLESIEAREKQLEVSNLIVRLEESEKRADVITDFTHGLVRNTSFRKVLEKSKHIPGYTAENGIWIQDRYENDTETETKTEE